MRFFPLMLCFFGLYIYVRWVWRKCNKAFPFAIIFLIEIGWQFSSIVWLDCGSYIPEQLRYSYYTGASFRYIVLMLPFAIIFPLFTQKNILKIEANLHNKNAQDIHLSENKTTDLYVKVFSYGVVFYEFLNLILTGIPLFGNISKAQALTMSAKLPLAGTMHTYFFPFIMLYSGINIGRILIKRQSLKNNKALFVLPGLVFLFQILLNNKFFGLYDFVIYLILPVIVMLETDANRRKRIPIKWVICTLLGIGALMYICYNHYAQKGDNPMQALLDRIFALQSHTFWGVDLQLQNRQIGFDAEQLNSELVNGFLGVSDYNPNFGIARIMYLVTRSTYADDMINTGFLFAGNFLTVTMSFCGYYITFVWSILFGFIFAKISSLFYKYLKDNSVLGIYLLFFVYNRCFTYFRVGNPAMIISWKLLVAFVMIFFISLAAKRKKVR